MKFHEVCFTVCIYTRATCHNKPPELLNETRFAAVSALPVPVKFGKTKRQPQQMTNDDNYSNYTLLQQQFSPVCQKSA